MLLLLALGGNGVEGGMMKREENSYLLVVGYSVIDGRGKSVTFDTQLVILLSVSLDT